MALDESIPYQEDRVSKSETWRITGPGGTDEKGTAVFVWSQTIGCFQRLGL